MTARHTWRHDSALLVLAGGFGKSLQPQMRLRVDLPTLGAKDNPPATILPEILDTTIQPDHVVVHKHESLS